MKKAFAKLFGGRQELAVTEMTPQDTVQDIALSLILPNRYQPRKVFDSEKIEELAATISEHGLLQPIVVRPMERGYYEIIAGERRFRAIKLLGWPTITAIVREMDDETTAALALIENLQREQLTPIEEAEAYERLLGMQNITQEALASSLGKSQSTIANKLRLLKLPADVQHCLRVRTINERHARALLPLKQADLQVKLLVEILENGYNVKETEQRVEMMLSPLAPEKLKKRRRQPKGVTRDVRIAVNTIRDSIDLIEKAGIPVGTEQVDHEEFVEIRIRIPKARPQA